LADKLDMSGIAAEADLPVRAGRREAVTRADNFVTIS
jgi:hypothetical protein